MHQLEYQCGPNFSLTKKSTDSKHEFYKVLLSCRRQVIFLQGDAVMDTAKHNAMCGSMIGSLYLQSIGRKAVAGEGSDHKRSLNRAVLSLNCRTNPTSKPCLAGDRFVTRGILDSKSARNSQIHKDGVKQVNHQFLF